MPAEMAEGAVLRLVKVVRTSQVQLFLPRNPELPIMRSHSIFTPGTLPMR